MAKNQLTLSFLVLLLGLVTSRIIENPRTYSLFYGDWSGVAGTGALHQIYRWPKIDGYVTVPYEFDSSYSFTEFNIIHTAMMIISFEVPCIRFVPRSYENDYIFVYRGSECSSNVGRIGGRQVLTLGDDCFYAGAVIHELLHALGFHHMHSHPDRDSFVWVDNSNVNPNYEPSFRKLSYGESTSYGTAYDYYSIMHYSSHAGAIDISKPTIVPLQQGMNSVIGLLKAMSHGDKYRLSQMYDCPA